jgi:hypothetical protein
MKLTKREKQLIMDALVSKRENMEDYQELYSRISEDKLAENSSKRIAELETIIKKLEGV